MVDDTKRPKRPRDANQLAKAIVDIATGAETDEQPPDNALQRKGGQKGGIARAISMTPEERSEVARLAAEARWKKD